MIIINNLYIIIYNRIPCHFSIREIDTMNRCSNNPYIFMWLLLFDFEEALELVACG